MTTIMTNKTSHIVYIINFNNKNDKFDSKITFMVTLRGVSDLNLSKQYKNLIPSPENPLKRCITHAYSPSGFLSVI